MYAIQNGPNWWIDSIARFPVGQVESHGRIGAMNDTYSLNPLDTDEYSGSFHSKFLDEDGQDDAVDESFNQSLKDQMLQDPAATFAATSPGEDRQGLFALLKA